MSNNNNNVPSWLSITNTIATIIITLGLSTWLSIINNRLESYKTAYTYINTLSNPNTPAYAKGIALTSLLRFKLIEPDLLFNIAYRIEDEYQEETNNISYASEVLINLFYQYGDKHKIISSPLGYVGGLKVFDKTQYQIYGWSLDREGIDKYEVRINGEKIKTTIENYEREDIKKIFKRYKNFDQSGFKILFSQEELPNNDPKKPYLLEVRLINKQNRYMVIFSRNICFSNDKIYQISSEESCTINK